MISNWDECDPHELEVVAAIEIVAADVGVASDDGEEGISGVSLGPD